MSAVHESVSAEPREVAEPLKRIEAELTSLRREMVAFERDCGAAVDACPAERRASARNLLHYLAFRRRDERELQARLARVGLSSLGRAESHVMAAVDAVLRVVRSAGRIAEPGDEPPPPLMMDEGRALLGARTDALLGPAREGRRVRIMVTMPSQAATDRALIRRLVEAGMDVMRINCAHDDAESWARMIDHLRSAERASGFACKVLMDLGGPKVRTGPLASPEDKIILNRGDRLVIRRGLAVGCDAIRGATGEVLHAAEIGCTLPEVFADARAGERVWLDDGRIGGVIRSVDAAAGRIDAEITHAPPREAPGEKLRADKGINLPDTALHIASVTPEDEAVLPFVAAHADMIGLSFVQRAADAEGLLHRLADLGPHRPALVLKIETRRAFENLPELLLAAMHAPAAGVMIARGDLAVEAGYERLAELQEEILWMCEASHLPVIWATQVLESLAKKGLPSRAEITDAAMGERAECVMLNKGPYVLEAVRMLDNILRRMAPHQFKKVSMLRALRIADRFAEGHAKGAVN